MNELYLIHRLHVHVLLKANWNIVRHSVAVLSHQSPLCNRMPHLQATEQRREQRQKRRRLMSRPPISCLGCRRSSPYRTVLSFSRWE